MFSTVDPQGSGASKFTFAASNQHDSDISDFILEDGTKADRNEIQDPKSKTITLLLAILLGFLGVDWLYLSCGNSK